MTTYDKLDNEHRAWSVKEAADFLGYSVSHLRRLMREGKMDGCWLKAQEDGRPRFCPAKVKVWMETRSKSKVQRKPRGTNKAAVESSEKKNDEKTPYSISPATQL
ncbi:MAG TPA: helix-turn-helix domain-containing protein [Candidatus Angelobacter sp.]|nr:helix-turn-helix domain-containing protein [Candidatus Angelobacter sp.]